ncbi:MAG: lipopolysaccharide export system permease protein [Limisphaerales bacterium]|jgi:lipopolysaccharide export system permease protein
MRLLDRYLIREWLIPFIICLAGFMILWIAFDLINGLDEFAGLGAAEIARFYWVTLPGNFFFVVPVALLLSLMYAINQHSRHHEFIAIRNAGVGMFRMSAPYLLVGVLLSAGLYWSNERWLPSGLREGEIIKGGQATGEENPLGRGWIANVNFHNDEANRDWQIPAFNPATGEMSGVDKNPIIISWKWNDDQPKREIMAVKGRWENGGWTFYQVKDYMPTEGFPEVHPITLHQTLRLEEIDETPMQIEGELKIKPLFDKRAHKRWSVSLAEIDGYRRIHPDIAPEKKAILSAQYQARLAEPLTCLIVVLIAIPFAAPSGRRNAAVGVAAGIIACLAFFMVQQFAMAVGGQLSPHFAAWTPHALFGGLSAWQITKVR